MTAQGRILPGAVLVSRALQNREIVRSSCRRMEADQNRKSSVSWQPGCPPRSSLYRPRLPCQPRRDLPGEPGRAAVYATTPDPPSLQTSESENRPAVGGGCPTSSVPNAAAVTGSAKY